MEDNRVFARINTRLPVRFLNPVDGSEGVGETTDISANGVGFVTNQELTNRTPLEMWLNIPDKHEPLYTRGRVMWAGANPGIGNRRIGVRLDRAELMGLARVLWLEEHQ
ncbi:MAG: PilZ domain-containing protein [Candidatus Omnitrophota bacterium]